MEPASNRWKNSLTTRRLVCTLSFCLCGIVSSAFGQDNWLGGAGLWSDASKWSAGVPTSSSQVYIDHGKAGASPVTINFNGAQSGDLTIDSDDSLTLADGTIFTVFGPTIANAGGLTLDAVSGSAIMDFSGAVTLTGTGGLTMSNNSNNSLMAYGQPSPGSSLTNKTTIQGAGAIGGAGGIGNGNTFINQKTIDSNQTTPLTINIGGSSTFTNTGTLEATNKATLAIANGTLTNTGGTIHADPASVVTLSSAIINGGTLTTSGNGTIQAICCLSYSTLDGVTLKGTFQLANDNIGYLQGVITNDGSLQVNSTGSGSYLDLNGPVTLTGSGALTMSDNANNYIMGYAQPSPGSSLTNRSTIQGGGNIGWNGGLGNGNTLTNDKTGTIYASAKTPLTIGTASGTFTNNGALKAKAGSTLYVSGGGFTNGPGLVGGTYLVSGTLEVDGANVATVASSITLTGATAEIINQRNANALTSVGAIASKSTLSLQGGQQLSTTLTNDFMNAGTLTVGKNSVFTVACSPMHFCPYKQTAGVTTVDGTLKDSNGVNIQAGTLLGTGTVAAPVTSIGTVTAGDSRSKAGVLSLGTYTQNTKAKLFIQLGGTTVGTQYSQLAVGGGVSLAGTLTVTLINGFTPAIGDVFKILTGTAISNKFTTVNLPVLSGAHWLVTYSSTSLTLTVESGA